MKAWILFFIGTLAYFIYKYINRSSKTPRSLKIWFNENWARLTWAFLLDLSAMLIIMDSGTKIDLSALMVKIPWIVLPGKLVLASLVGYGFGVLGYSFAKKRTIKKINE